MTAETILKLDGMKALTGALGDVDAERFIALIQRDPFDYTAWQKDLWPGKSIAEISSAAVQSRKDSRCPQKTPNRRRLHGQARALQNRRK